MVGIDLAAQHGRKRMSVEVEGNQQDVVKEKC